VQNYLLRRAFFVLGSMIGVSLIIFVVFRILLGDPLVAILGVEGYNKMAPADHARIMADRPSDPASGGVRPLAARDHERAARQVVLPRLNHYPPPATRTCRSRTWSGERSIASTSRMGI
jgi:hypothetical protein